MLVINIHSLSSKIQQPIKLPMQKKKNKKKIAKGGTVVKYLLANAGDAGDVGLIPWLGRSPGGGNGNPLQNSCLRKSMDRGAWRAIVHGVANKSDTIERCGILLSHKKELL